LRLTAVEPSFEISPSGVGSNAFSHSRYTANFVLKGSPSTRRVKMGAKPSPNALRSSSLRSMTSAETSIHPSLRGPEAVQRADIELRCEQSPPRSEEMGMRFA
jgi:hypothetical protein